MRWIALVGVVTGCSFDGGSSTIDASQAIDASPIDGISVDASTIPEGFGARRMITVANPQRPALPSFPVPLRFDGSDPRMGTFGSQLRFQAIDGTALSFEVEQMGAEALVWVRVDLAADKDVSFAMLYDNPDIETASNGSTTFADHAGVYHFFDDYGGATPTNTAVGNHNLQPTELTSQANNAQGLGTAVELVGSDGFFQTSAFAPELNLGDNDSLTYEAWFRTTEQTKDRTILTSLDVNCRGVLIFVADGVPAGAINGALVTSFWHNPDCSQPLDEVTFTNSSNRVDDGDWHHFAVVINRTANTQTLFLDGTQTVSVAGVPATGNNGGRETQFGSNNVGDNFNGQLDELRIGIPRNESWFRAGYELGNPNVPTTLVTIGDEETR